MPESQTQQTRLLPPPAWAILLSSLISLKQAGKQTFTTCLFIFQVEMIIDYGVWFAYLFLIILCRRGLAAARHLRKGELILKVPKSALMTADSLLRKNPKLSSVITKHPFLCPVQVNLLLHCFFQTNVLFQSKHHVFVIVDV